MKTLKINKHYRMLGHILLGLIGIFFGIYQSSMAAPIQFSDQLSGAFPYMTTNNSSITFNYGGQNFAGGFFWNGVRQTLAGGESISISGGNQTIICSKKLIGIYYNVGRLGATVFPLDETSLTILRGLSTDYNGLSITGGFYTNCIQGLGGFTPDINGIYGYIKHTRLGNTYEMIAGMNYNFTNNQINGNNFATTFTMSGGVLSGYIYDKAGNAGIGQMSLTSNTCNNCERTPSQGGICSGFNLSNTSITQGTNTTLTCNANPNGNSISGYIFWIYQYQGGSSLYNNVFTTTSPSQTRNTGSALSQGTYIITCSILGIGTGAGGQCGTNQYLVVGTGVTQNPNCNLQGNITIVQKDGSIVQASPLTPDYYYSKTTGNIEVQLQSNIPSYYSITSSQIINPLTGIYNYSYNPPLVNNLNTGNIQLTNIDGRKQITTTFTSGSCSYTAPNKWFTLDLLAPNTPTLTYPTNNTGVCYIGNFPITWDPSTDDGVGIGSYDYIISNSPDMSGYILTGSSTTTGASINANSIGSGYLSGTYYLAVKAIDRLGQSGKYTTGIFNIAPTYCSNYNNILIYGIIPMIRNAYLNTEYISDEFSIVNLPAQTLAILNTGTLYINGKSTNSTTGLVKNGDSLSIKLKSSNTTGTTNSANITIGPRNATFYVQTRGIGNGTGSTGGECNIGDEKKLVIQNIFDMMIDTYKNKGGLLSEFTFTMQSMLKDEVDISNDCSLSYLLDTVDSYIINDLQENDIDESDHKAPNCKVYKIKYNEERQGYTSSTFKKKVYFASRDSLTRFIDSQNPGSCHINKYNELDGFENINSGYWTAPNGKIYKITSKQNSDGLVYYSPELIKLKYFSSQEDLQTFIDANNPGFDVRDHEVDSDFNPVTFVTANGKEYKIYNTDQGYMSYKLMKIQYFDSLEEIQNYINKNNKK